MTAGNGHRAFIVFEQHEPFRSQRARLEADWPALAGVVVALIEQLRVLPTYYAGQIGQSSTWFYRTRSSPLLPSATVYYTIEGTEVRIRAIHLDDER